MWTEYHDFILFVPYEIVQVQFNIKRDQVNRATFGYAVVYT
jgi:hypothetical protein